MSSLLLYSNFSAIIEAAAEVCNVEDDSAKIRMAREADIWVTLLSLTRKTAASRRKSIDPPATKTPHSWKDWNKHTALWNLLSIAVSHKDLQLRKAYIERIMKLSPTTQRLLMSMIEKRKKKGKTRTPSKTSKTPTRTPTQKSCRKSNFC